MLFLDAHTLINEISKYRDPITPTRVHLKYSRPAWCAGADVASLCGMPLRMGDHYGIQLVCRVPAALGKDATAGRPRQPRHGLPSNGKQHFAEYFFRALDKDFAQCLGGPRQKRRWAHDELTAKWRWQRLCRVPLEGTRQSLSAFPSALGGHSAKPKHFIECLGKYTQQNTCSLQSALVNAHGKGPLCRGQHTAKCCFFLFVLFGHVNGSPLKCSYISQ